VTQLSVTGADLERDAPLVEKIAVSLEKRDLWVVNIRRLRGNAVQLENPKALAAGKLTC
jgi:hypothetical protein